MDEYRNGHSGIAILIDCSGKPGWGWELLIYCYHSGLLTAVVYDLSTYESFVTCTWNNIAIEWHRVDQETSANLSGYATQDWVNQNFSNVKATLVGSNLGKMLSLSSGDSLSTILSKVGDGESLYGRFNAAMRFLNAHTPEWGGYLDKAKLLTKGVEYKIRLDPGTPCKNYYTFSPFHNRFLRTNRNSYDWAYPADYGFVQSGNITHTEAAYDGTYADTGIGRCHPEVKLTATGPGVWLIFLATNPTGNTIVSNYELLICIG